MIMQLRTLSIAAIALVTVVAGTARAQSNPHIGMWKGNIAKSTATPGTAVKSNSTKIEAEGAGMKATVDTVYADGTVRHWVFTANYDG